MSKVLSSDEETASSTEKLFRTLENEEPHDLNTCTYILFPRASYSKLIPFQSSLSVAWAVALALAFSERGQIFSF